MITSTSSSGGAGGPWFSATRSCLFLGAVALALGRSSMGGSGSVASSSSIRSGDSCVADAADEFRAGVGSRSVGVAAAPKVACPSIAISEGATASMDVTLEWVLVSVAVPAAVPLVRSSPVASGDSATPLLSILASVSFVLGPGESDMKDSSVACVPPGEGEPDIS